MTSSSEAKVRREFENWFSGLRGAWLDPKMRAKGRAHLSRLDEEKKKELIEKALSSGDALR